MQCISKEQDEYSLIMMEKPEETQPNSPRRRVSQSSTDQKILTSCNSDPREETEVRSCKELVWEFCRYTTAHGWGRVGKSSLPIVKVLWVIITICALTLNAGHITLLVTHFKEFQSEIRWRVQVSEIHFPSITLCNMQAMSASTKQVMASDPSTRIYTWEKTIANLHQFDPLASLLNQSETFERVKHWLHEPRGYFQNIGDEFESVGHQLKDFILDCTFAHQPCDMQDFVVFANQDYFNCYTFNGGNISRETIVSKSTGPSAGLSLILYLETNNGDLTYNKSYDKYSNLGASAGVRVVVHAPNTRPYPQEKGVDIPPGFTASIGLRFSKHTRLDEPYGDCFNERLDPMLSEYRYTMSDCLLVCKQIHVMDTCRCISSLLPLPESNSPVPYCGRWDVHNLQDLSEYLQRITCEHEAIINFTIEKKLTECQCLAACETHEYNSHLSYSSWPLRSTQRDFYEFYVLGNPEYETLKAFTNLWPFNMSGILEKDLIAKNFARLNIYIQDPVVEIHSQKASYDWPNLASDIGGTFGLWIGMSLITWCEVLELLVYVVYAKVKTWGSIKPPTGVTRECNQSKS